MPHSELSADLDRSAPIYHLKMAKVKKPTEKTPKAKAATKVKKTGDTKVTKRKQTTKKATPTKVQKETPKHESTDGVKGIIIEAW